MKQEFGIKAYFTVTHRDKDGNIISEEIVEGEFVDGRNNNK